MSKKDVMNLVVDSREPERYFDFIKGAFPEINVTREGSMTGDYISDLARAERKTLMDLHGSIMKQRIFDQEERMSCDDGVQILYIQGSMSKYVSDCEANGVIPMPDHLYGVIASASVRYGFLVIWCENEWSGLVTLVKTFKKIHEGKYLMPAKKDDDILLSRFLGCNVAQLNSMKNLAGPTLSDIIEISEETLKKIYRIGPKKAAQIKAKLIGEL